MLFPRYEDALVLLLTEVLNRIQFRYNQAQLEELDDETLDDDVRAFSPAALVHHSASEKCILPVWTRTRVRETRCHAKCFNENVVILSSALYLPS